jgi:hypothetical protein
MVLLLGQSRNMGWTTSRGQATATDPYVLPAHAVRRKVEWRPRRTVLPPDLCAKYAGLAYGWPVT